MSQDIIHFEEILRTTSGATEGYLIINSPGGDGNVAEKIITMCRQRFTKSFNVIVPNFAKSAATMIALCSDKILMGYLAELGQIDPQLGNPIAGGFIPARSFIVGAFEFSAFFDLFVGVIDSLWSSKCEDIEYCMVHFGLSTLENGKFCVVGLRVGLLDVFVWEKMIVEQKFSKTHIHSHYLFAHMQS